ncbi:MAG: hypothetical protein UU24_C0006G0017 [Candidatus Nomurabacteria bacterium GW2011_GWA2_40_9]|uniref:PEP-utilising enzyme mobile domain-containing protein n=1 Tax=Candidatus Nomurabacteria bacterium GW2011_GWA2_40_9 TaxID=1618734 RepID=A0A0G0TRB1_9BACT|nr:MAG: hypothetical protein UU24_C0006G0017 [Candidatus Nomurabacteria bacterium GW2011_GWA2_40_9]
MNHSFQEDQPNKIIPLKAIILGANRGIRRLDSTKSYPHALGKGIFGKSVLDWQLSSFKACGIKDIVFVGGYHLEKIIAKYPGLNYYFNPKWDSSGSLFSLFCAREELTEPCLIIYSDVVFRLNVLQQFIACSQNNKIIIGIDRSPDTDLREMYKSEHIESVQLSHENLVKIGPQMNSLGKEDGLFTGLCFLPQPIVSQLKEKFTSPQWINSPHIKKLNFSDMLQELLKEGKNFQTYNISQDWAKIQNPFSLARFIFGTKAQTLERLRQVIKGATILDQIRFSVEDWTHQPENILNKIQKKLSSNQVIIRSSASSEDTWESSNAGLFYSEKTVDINNRDLLHQGIERVISSFQAATGEHNLDQVFVQPYISNLKMSGVIFTRELESGAPYIIINYSSHPDKTDVITSGWSDNVQTFIVYKYTDFKGTDPNIIQLLKLVKELEQSTNLDSLDIEFAIDQHDDCFLFQARPLVLPLIRKKFNDKDFVLEKNSIKTFINNLMQRRPYLFGEKTILGNMPDWNPAEMIGTAPRPLALTLYQYLITDKVWGESRQCLGYKDTYPEPLMISLAGKPYIDIRTSLNSFLPKELSLEVSERLINYYLERLQRYPNFFDKLEFEVAITCLSFDFDKHARNLTESGFQKSSIDEIKTSVLKLTNNILNETSINLDHQLQQLEILTKRRENILSLKNISASEILKGIHNLLDDCIRYGTLPFSNLARCAFISTAFLKSLHSIKILSQADYDLFLQSIPTIASEISEDMTRMVHGSLSMKDFLNRYGHLRPGTYDILSPRYDESPEIYFPNIIQTNSLQEKRNPIKTERDAKEIILEKRPALNALLKQHGITCSSEQLVYFMVKSIQAREYAKFEFTKNISVVLQKLSQFGEINNMSIDDMSFTSIYYLLSLSTSNPPSDIKRDLKMHARRHMKQYALTQSIQLPSLIYSSDDLDYFYHKEMQPNFITSKKVTADLLKLDKLTHEKLDLTDKIICIENADPGYDWIFGYKIAGLVTKYGGIASHMSIRAAEFGLPAAIGCGDVIFQKILHSTKIELNCATRQIHFVK